MLQHIQLFVQPTTTFLQTFFVFHRQHEEEQENVWNSTLIPYCFKHKQFFYTQAIAFLKPLWQAN